MRDSPNSAILHPLPTLAAPQSLLRRKNDSPPKPLMIAM